LDKTQLGRAGELALALYALVGTEGELQLYTPVADDDHTDVTIGRRGLVPAIALQVKTTSHLDGDGLVEAKAEYPAGEVREHPAFLYAVLLLESVSIATAWLVPSADFNRLAYRTTTGKREVLAFRARPGGGDRYASFLVPPLELGNRLLAVIESLPESVPRDLLRGGEVLGVGLKGVAPAQRPVTAPAGPPSSGPAAPGSSPPSDTRRPPPSAAAAPRTSRPRIPRTHPPRPAPG